MTAKKGTPRRPPAKKTATKRPAKPRTKTRPKPEPLSVLDAVERDLAEIAKVDKHLARSALAACAQALATEIDNTTTSATLKVTAARALADTLAQLRELMPRASTTDTVDELTTRRNARRSGRTKA